jgi:NAD(P)-dependent dehydrogenase (short-subunit alcohol dehydrogenase family)
MDMKTVLITGANRGLGLEFARQYAADGWHVTATCRSPQNAEALMATGAEVLPLDVTDFESFPAFADRFGDHPLDILLNNAGIVGDGARSALDADIDEWLTAFRTNALAPAILTRHLLPNLRRADRPVGATIGSVDGLFKFVTGADKAVYTSTKAAAHMVTISLAQALKEERVIYVSLRPGQTKTDMTGGKGYKAEESIDLLRGVLETVTLAETGSFIDRSGRILSYSGDFEG